MKLWSDSFVDGEAIPAEFAFARIDPKHHVALAPNRNPRLAWWDLPPELASIAAGEFSEQVVPKGRAGPQMLAAMQGRLLARATISGRYSLNPRLAEQPVPPA